MVRKIIWAFAGVLILVSLAGCSKHSAKSKSEPYLRIFPEPPDTTRIQYLTTINSSDDVKKKQSAFNRFLFGEDEPLPVVKPYGLAADTGILYVCDTKIEGLIKMNIEKGTFDYFIPGGRGQLKLPINCDLDDQGNIYVSDGERLQVVIFDKDGKYLNAFGAEEPFKPTDVYVEDDKIWVANISNHQVHVYNRSDYTPLYTLPDKVKGEEGYLFQPVSVYVRNNLVYVTDIGDNRIKVFTTEGEFVRQSGGSGASAGRFQRPKGISVDESGNTYVVDAAFENVQIFNDKGEFLMFFGGPYRKPGDMYLPAGVEVDYTNTGRFESFVDPEFTLKYLIFVTNQFGPDKINVYGFVGPVR